MNTDNLIRVTSTNLELDRRVIDSDNNIGYITNMDDIHNIEIMYELGGFGFWCLDINCNECDEDFGNFLFYY